MSDVTVSAPPRHRTAIFVASFLTLIAAGMGFAIRGGILNDWAAQYGFTKFELGTITGGGLVGFGAVILAASLITDRLGYKAILLLAFLCHVVSAAITLAATPVFNSAGKDATYWCLYVGMFLFSIGNGLCEAVINPLVATLYPTRKTHYLNILHAGWPGGLVIGAVLAKMFTGLDSAVTQLRWEIPMCFFLVPTLIYGFITIKERFPVSEARAAGVTFGQQLAQFASPLLLFLLLLHACVGYVELGTDSWITNITNEIVAGQGLYLFIWASSIMFVLRFFAGPIVERINPLGLLFVSACLGAVGLYLIGSTAGVMVWVAVTIYALGKTFLWPTMLGVVGERFPKGGALAMGMMGGVGMLSAGLLGSPGIGYKQDYYASEQLRATAPSFYDQFKSSDEKSFLLFPAIAGLDGRKVGDLKEKIETAKIDKKQPLSATEQDARGPVLAADIYGGRMALKWTALVPAMMAVGYLLLLVYFRLQGGYKVELLHRHEEEPAGEPLREPEEVPVA